MRIVSGSSCVDANVLVYSAVKADPRNEAARTLLTGSGKGILYISPQIITEFYSAITSAKRVTNPYSPLEAVEFIETLLGYRHISILAIPQDIPTFLLPLLKRTQVAGARVFDVQIVATMMAHGLKKLFSYNGRDFTQFAELDVIEPS